MKATRLGAGFAVVAFLSPFAASAATLYSQDISLSPGWNIVSTPKVLDSHSFSAAETSDNFDIYALDPSQPSGWATMASLGQSEFTPLYGYFIDNKSGTDQTLTFNYASDLAPNDKLFERQFSTPGWYSVGIANPTYALPVASSSDTDTDNQRSILNALIPSGVAAFDSVLDFTDGASDINSVAVNETWKAATAGDLGSLNDFRETKGYAIYVTQANARYSGFENDALPPSQPAMQCADGADNDNNGLTDYPTDTGCTSADDDSEIGPIVVVGSTMSATATQADTASQSYGTFTLKFTVTANGDDVYIPKYIASTTSSTAYTGVVVDPNLNTTAGGTIVASLSSTADSENTMFYVIHDGDSEIFTATVRIDPIATGFYQVGLDKIRYSFINTDLAHLQTLEIDQTDSDFQTDAVAISN